MALPDDHQQLELPTDKINLAYFGVFYATRGLTEVWQALRRLPAWVAGDIALHVFTSKPDELRTELAEAGLTDVVTANPYVSYLEYLNLASRVDVLIVNDARTVGIHDRNPYLPSKWSDYSGSGTAVWGIVEPGSILSAQPLQHRSELGDVDGALRVLAEPGPVRHRGRPWPAWTARRVTPKRDRPPSRRLRRSHGMVGRWAPCVTSPSCWPVAPAPGSG